MKTGVINIEEQLSSLKKLELPRDQFIVAGSMPLAIRGIRSAKDIDMIVTPVLWDILSAKYNTKPNKWGVETFCLPDQIEILNPKQSIFGNSSIIPLDELLEKADIFDGIKFMNLGHLRKMKLKLGRDKDLQDVKLIDVYLKSKEDTETGTLGVPSY